MKKKIAIIGSGIAGLTLAGLLQNNSNFEFVVYEKEDVLNLDEGFGIPILEALSFSIPTICSDIDVFREIGNNSVEFFNAGDPNSLASKITFLLNEEETRKKLVINGLEHIKKFNRKNFIKGFEDKRVFGNNILNVSMPFSNNIGASFSAAVLPASSRS